MNAWGKISLLGTEKYQTRGSRESKRLVFFNQVLFVGLFATLFQIAFVWPFIGAKSLVFLVVCAAIITSLVFNARGYFSASKWVYVIFVYSMGILTTMFLGGAALYHLQALLIFTSCLVLFDLRKEKFQILIGLPLLAISFLIGEAGLFDAPDFSTHPWTPIARYANISSMLVINSILILFIIRLNNKNEDDLSDALSEVTSKTSLLEKGKTELEALVKERTAELSQQHNILLQQNEEKNILLKEVHHRVRNNLQIIVSLINLQMAKFNDEVIRNALREIQGRVRSMSLVHQKMYETSNFKEIALSDYTAHIIDNIKVLYDQRDIKYSLEIPEKIKLNIETAIPLGLIINEIITNFFKHGQISDENEIAFSLHLKVSDTTCQLLYRDYGKGFPKDLDPQASGSLGLQLIDSLITQLDGEFSFHSDNGAVYEISLPEICSLNKMAIQDHV